MSLSFIHSHNLKNYQTYSEEHPLFSLWQSFEWKEFQEKIGRKCMILTLEAENSIFGSALCIKHSLPMGKSWIEVPRGPLFTENISNETIQQFQKQLRQLGKQEGAVFIRINPWQKLSTAFYKGIQHQTAFFDHHPETSLVLNLQLLEEELLKQMKPKGRYNIKVAEKHGVVIEKSTDAQGFYNLLKETWERDGFRGHTQSYYQNMVESLGEKGALLYARYEGNIIAGGIFSYIGNTGVYYYGASSNEHRNVMAPYLIQWEAIKEAKKRGLKYYDFLGISAPNDPKDHPWRGVTDFKCKFGGEIQTYPEAQDIVLQRMWYIILKIKKRLRG